MTKSCGSDISPMNSIFWVDMEKTPKKVRAISIIPTMAGCLTANFESFTSIPLYDLDPLARKDLILSSDNELIIAIFSIYLKV